MGMLWFNFILGLKFIFFFFWGGGGGVIKIVNYYNYFLKKEKHNIYSSRTTGINNGDVFCGLKINCIFSPRKKQRKRSWGLILTGGPVP